MTYREAIKSMCERCTNHEMCMGIGCEPKKTLENITEEFKKELKDGLQFVEFTMESDRYTEEEMNVLCAYVKTLFAKVIDAIPMGGINDEVN